MIMMLMIIALFDSRVVILAALEKGFLLETEILSSQQVPNAVCTRVDGIAKL